MSNRGSVPREVWRFDILGPDFVVGAPEGAEPVHVGFQNRAPYSLCVWMLVDPTAPKGMHPLITTATGETIPENAEHVGTAQSPEGLVWHVWRPRGL